jgi:hypothetical protein
VAICEKYKQTKTQDSFFLPNIQFAITYHPEVLFPLSSLKVSISAGVGFVELTI